MHPKPTKKQRLLDKADRQHSLGAYRRINSARAIERDNAQCGICFFKFNRNRRGTEVHHVYSRGRRAGDWREHYRSLLYVCKECHPMAIQVPGASSKLEWVEEILEQANETPINKKFKHSEV